MEHIPRIDLPKITNLSKRKLFGRVIFWVFFSIMAIELAILSTSYLIFMDHTLNQNQQAMLMFLLGCIISSISAAAIILVIRWVIIDYNADAINRSDHDHRTLDELHRAMKNQELEVYYQPQIDLQSNKIIGMETLIRWNHDIMGFISPSEFIPLAEQAGLIEAIDCWVLETACIQNKKFLDKGYELCIAVNISALLLSGWGIVSSVQKILERSQMPAKYLELEITETAMIKDINSAIAVMYKLRELGVTISMDDFGTGYSSLSSLDRFPIQKIKIDKVFVHGISEYHDEPNLADTIINMGHRLKLKLLAEGIETEYQKNYLKNLGCDQGQGYFFGEPIPAADFEKLLQR